MRLSAAVFELICMTLIYFKKQNRCIGICLIVSSTINIIMTIEMFILQMIPNPNIERKFLVTYGVTMSL